MLFAGILFAVFLDACTRGLAYVLPVPRRWRFGLVMLVLASLAALAIAWGIIRLPAQVAHADAGDGQPARRPRSLSCHLRHRPVRPGRPARPVAIHRRSWPPVRPRPVCGERRLCLRHHDHRHHLPRPVLRRPAGGLPRRRADPRAAGRPPAHARGHERDGPGAAQLAAGPARAQRHRRHGAGGNALLARRARRGPARAAGRGGQFHSLSRAADRRPADRPGDHAARPVDAGLGPRDLLPHTDHRGLRDRPADPEGIGQCRAGLDLVRHRAVRRDVRRHGRRAGGAAARGRPHRRPALLRRGLAEGSPLREPPEKACPGSRRSAPSRMDGTGWTRRAAAHRG